MKLVRIFPKLYDLPYKNCLLFCFTFLFGVVGVLMYPFFMGFLWFYSSFSHGVITIIVNSSSAKEATLLFHWNDRIVYGRIGVNWHNWSTRDNIDIDTVTALMYVNRPQHDIDVIAPGTPAFIIILTLWVKNVLYVCFFLVKCFFQLRQTIRLDLDGSSLGTCFLLSYLRSF